MLTSDTNTKKRKERKRKSCHTKTKIQSKAWRKKYLFPLDLGKPSWYRCHFAWDLKIVTATNHFLMASTVPGIVYDLL